VSENYSDTNLTLALTFLAFLLDSASLHKLNVNEIMLDVSKDPKMYVLYKRFSEKETDGGK